MKELATLVAVLALTTLALAHPVLEKEKETLKASYYYYNSYSYSYYSYSYYDYYYNTYNGSSSTTLEPVQAIIVGVVILIVFCILCCVKALRRNSQQAMMRNQAYQAIPPA